MIDPVGDANGNDCRPRLQDAAVVLILVGLVVANTALAPSNTPAHSQWRQMGATVATMNSGQWLLPRNQIGEVPSKGPLQAWLTVPLLKLTGAYSDLVYRLPPVAAALALGVLVYLLGCRWYGRRVGLLSACLWATGLHMGHLVYLCTTDMLVTLWMTLSIFCADRLLFHRLKGQRDGAWAAGLWGSMILAGMTKGWGLMNPVLVGGMFGLAAAVGPGFKALRRATGVADKAVLVGRLILRRWRAAIQPTRLIGGMILFAGAMAVLLALMFLQGRHAFGGRFAFEIKGRIFGGEDAPRRGSAPPVLALLYYCLPATLFMMAGLLQVPLRKWLRRPGPTWLPLCWILSVVLPYSFTHGFRADYLLPCYPAAAMLGAWALERLARAPEARGRRVRAIRHVVAAGPVIIGGGLILAGTLYLYHDDVLAACRGYAGQRGVLPSLARPAAVALEREMTLPPTATAATWWLCRAVPVLGAVVLVLAVKASLQWNIRRLALLTVVGMLGVLFVDRHFAARYARSGDGEKAMAFARLVDHKIGKDPFAVYKVSLLATEPYLGRFGTYIRTVEHLRDGGARWLITTEKGVMDLGRRRGPTTAGGQEMSIGRSGVETVVEQFGRIEYEYPDAIIDDHLGGRRMLLIRLR